jgi:uncharacterized protein (DUF2147 family)
MPARDDVGGRKMMWRSAAVALAGLTLLSTAATAQDAKGTWLTEGGRSRIRVTDCGATLCGAIVWLREPNDPATGKPRTDKSNADAGKRNRPLIGVQTVLSMKAAGAGKWTGQLYNPEDGKTYSGSAMLQGANALKVEGCVASVFCKAQTWTRVN